MARDGTVIRIASIDTWGWLDPRTVLGYEPAAK
jgi:hypothetical protein